MKTTAGRRAGSRCTALLAAGVLGLSGLAACAQDDKDGGAEGSLSDRTRTELQERIAKAKAVPAFDHPGPAIDVSPLRGRLFYVIPFASNAEFNKVQADATVEAGRAAGVEVRVYTTTGLPSQHQQGMERAIADGAAAILLQGPDPALLRPQIERARRAGIPVVASHSIDVANEDETVPQIDGLTIAVPGPFSIGQRLLADFVALDSDGDAKALYLPQDDLGETAKAMVAAWEDQLKTVCPGCESIKVSTTFADAAAKTAGAVQTALQKDRDIDYIVAPLDFVVPYIETALRGLGNTTTKIVSFNGTGAVLKTLSEDGPQVANVGEPITVMGYTGMDQAMRLALGEDPVKEPIFIRLFTADNIAEAGNPPEVDGGYGDLDAYVDGYKELWGVS